MTNAKEIKKRIRSIGNTKKITKAMEMVAAAKMRRSIEAVLKTRTYANLGWMTILNISESLDANSEKHPLLEKRSKTEKAAIVLISSNRGLCGGFNSAIINKAIDSIKKHSQVETDFILIGKKGIAVQKHFGYKVVSEFTKDDAAPKVSDVYPIARFIIDEFLQKKYDKILMAYTDFVSPTKQVPRVRQILPFELEGQDEYLGAVGKSDKLGVNKEFVKGKEKRYLHGYKYLFEYEPNDKEVLDKILPRMIEVQLYQGLLESNASEHSSRMTSMHQASEAANDLVGELTLFYNKARQAAITSEIAEISAGVASLKA